MIIGITGVNGLIGWHLRAYLHGRRDFEVRGADRSTFADLTTLTDFVANVDAVVHLAGMNRGSDTELEVTNIALTDQLIAACDRAGSSPHIVFASSTHVERDTAYGRSKRVSVERLRRWAEIKRAPFTNFVLPHVFGEFGKPFYNSVVSTFCHQLADRKAPAIERDGELELVHTQEAAERIVQAIQSRENGDVRMRGKPLRVSELLAKLSQFSHLYDRQIVPDLRDPLDLRLFNTYRSYLFPRNYPVTLQVHVDKRGELFEAIKSMNPGQMFYSTTKPGVTRGNHYHTRKVERFLVTVGEAVIGVRKLFSRDYVEFEVNGAKPQYIDLPTFHTHNITNVGSTDLVTVFWAHEFYDPANSDTYPEPVTPP